MEESKKLVAILVAVACVIIAGTFFIRKQSAPKTVVIEPLVPQTSSVAAPVQTLTTKADVETFLAKEKPVVIKFSTNWCPPCKQIKPIFEEVAQLRADRAYFAAIDIEAFTDKTTLNSFGVQSIPTIIVFKDGKEAHRIVSSRNKKDLLAELEKAGA